MAESICENRGVMYVLASKSSVSNITPLKLYLCRSLFSTMVSLIIAADVL